MLCGNIENCLNMSVLQAVERVLIYTAAGNDSAIAKDFQLMRKRGLVDIQHMRHCMNAKLLALQRKQNAKARFVTENFKERRCILNQLFLNPLCHARFLRKLTLAAPIPRLRGTKYILFLFAVAATMCVRPLYQQYAYPRL